MEAFFYRPKLASTDRPSTAVWTVYVSEADRRDRALAQSWKGDMDALLIFAGLFSATITAFIIESYKTLSPDPTDSIIILLEHMSLQIAALANGTQTVAPPPLPHTSQQPSLPSVLCNTFWLLSLALSLTCALAATLVDQWARNYLNASDAHIAAHKRARVRAYLHTGLRRFGMKTIVEAIPTLLHISLLLFFAGLVEFMSPINTSICKLTIAILAVCSGLYIIITLLPLFAFDCPYETPFSALCWHTCQAVCSFIRGNASSTKRQHVTLSQAREKAAVEESQARNKRDQEAMVWTLQSLTEAAELEPFVDGIHDFLMEANDTDIDLMRHLVVKPNIRLGTRIVWLLRLSRYQNGPEKTKWTIACLTAIWSLLHNCWYPGQPAARLTDWFDDEALPVLEMFKYEGPTIGNHLSSTMALLLMGLLNSFSEVADSFESVSKMEVEVTSTLAESWVEQRQAESYLSSTSPQVSSGYIASLKAWLDRIVQTAQDLGPEGYPRLPSVVRDLAVSLQAFHSMVNEARITVFNDYVAELLYDHPPFETWDTFYDIAIDSRLKHMNITKVSHYNQTRLVDHLEWCMKLPRLAFDHLLKLVPIVDDPKLIERARGIIVDYSEICPDSVAASSALALLSTGQNSPSESNQPVDEES